MVYCISSWMFKGLVTFQLLQNELQGVFWSLNDNMIRKAQSNLFTASQGIHSVWQRSRFALLFLSFVCFSPSIPSTSHSPPWILTSHPCRQFSLCLCLHFPLRLCQNTSLFFILSCLPKTAIHHPSWMWQHWTGASWVRRNVWSMEGLWWESPASTSLIWPSCHSSSSLEPTPWRSLSRSSSSAATSPPRWQN